MCDEHVKPVLCVLNNCSWRYSGMKKTRKGIENFKSDWQNVGDLCQEFKARPQLIWTKLNIEAIATPLECAICMNFDYKFVKATTTLPCKHIFHSECLSKWFKRSETCPDCRSPCQNYYLD